MIYSPSHVIERKILGAGSENCLLHGTIESILDLSWSTDIPARVNGPVHKALKITDLIV
jgi:hypothetical protein